MFSFDEPNQSVVLAKDEVVIKDKDKNTLLSGSVEILLDLLPQPEINVYVNNIIRLLKVELFIKNRSKGRKEY